MVNLNVVPAKEEEYERYESEEEMEEHAEEEEDDKDDGTYVQEEGDDKGYASDADWNDVEVSGKEGGAGEDPDLESAEDGGESRTSWHIPWSLGVGGDAE